MINAYEAHMIAKQKCSGVSILIEDIAQAIEHRAQSGLKYLDYDLNICSSRFFKERLLNRINNEEQTRMLQYIEHYFSLLGYNVDAFSKEKNDIIKINWFHPYSMKDWYE